MGRFTGIHRKAFVFEGRSILAVVPARGGSKGVKLKNLRLLQGVPLVAWAGNLVRQMPWLDRSVVSTDHAEIARVSCESGLAAPFLRPESLSGDRIGDWDVLIHALEMMEIMDGKRYDIVLMLQPTSPFRRPSHVKAAVEKLVRGGYDSVWTVSETDSKHHPFKQLILEGEALGYYDERGRSIVARQQLTPLYHRNGAAYALTRECLLEQKSILGKRASAVVIRDPLVNIDSEDDIALAEFLLSRSGVKHRS